MRGWLVVAVLGLSTSGYAQPKPTAPDSITLRLHKPVKGDAWKQIDSVTIRIEDGGHLTTKLTHTERMVEVLDAKGDAYTRATMTFTADLETKNIDGQRYGGATVLSGKRYTIAAGTPLVVKPSAGGPISQAESDLLAKREKRFGKPDSVIAALDNKTFVRDKPTQIDRKDIRSDVPNLQIMKLVVTYKMASPDGAIFGVELVFEVSDDAGTKVVNELAGHFTFDVASGTVKLLFLEGPFKVTGTSSLAGTASIVASRSK